MTKPPSPRPLSIKVITSWYLLLILTKIAIWQDWQGDIAIFNFYFSGYLAILVNVSLIVLWAWIVIGLWGLWDIARRVAIGFGVYELINIIAAFVHPVTRLLAIAHIRGQNLAAPNEVSPEMVGNILALLVRIISAGVMIWFLIKRKSAFVKGP